MEKRLDNSINFKICVRLPEQRPLTYFVKRYETLDGGLIKFFDHKLNKFKIFDTRLCEIEVIGNE